MPNLRMRIHDEIAVPLLRDELIAFGYECHEMGTEMDSQALHATLMGLGDEPALMLRFRPDLIAAHQALPTLLAEVKCEYQDWHRNYAIEVDSYKAASIWNNAAQRGVIYAFVDLCCSNEGLWELSLNNTMVRFDCLSIGICWADEIPEPAIIRVPQRWDFQEQWERMGIEWPKSERIPWEFRGGSGTPYFLISKSSGFLQPPDVFIDSLGDGHDQQLELPLIA